MKMLILYPPPEETPWKRDTETAIVSFPVAKEDNVLDQDQGVRQLQIQNLDTLNLSSLYSSSLSLRIFVKPSQRHPAGQNMEHGPSQQNDAGAFMTAKSRNAFKAVNLAHPDSIRDCICTPRRGVGTCAYDDGGNSIKTFAFPHPGFDLLLRLRRP